MRHHHAFGIEAEVEKGIAIAEAWAFQELGMKVENNLDINVLRFGLFSVTDARRVSELVTGTPFVGESKVIIISANRVYHEAQNALLKVFEEPPKGTYIFLVLPTLGGLLPTLRSRVQILNTNYELTKSVIPEIAVAFLKANKEKRNAIIKKLTSGKDEEKRRENREEAIMLLNGIEAIIYNNRSRTSILDHAAFLSDVATLRTHLYDRSAPVKMILEHLSLVTPKDLV
jgi:DNA polymerase III delta prime subunit